MRERLGQEAEDEQVRLVRREEGVQGVPQGESRRIEKAY